MLSTCAKIAKLYAVDHKKAIKCMKEIPIYYEVASKRLLWGKTMHYKKDKYYIFIPRFYIVGTDQRSLQVSLFMRIGDKGPHIRYAKTRNEIQANLSEYYTVQGVHIEDTLGAHHVRFPPQLLRVLEKKLWMELTESIKTLKEAKQTPLPAPVSASVN